MASLQEDNSNVYLGVWTNWSRGPVLGATLTLTRSQADILIAFTSVFIGIVGIRMWRLICLLLHRCYSRPWEHSYDGLHHQRQLILRNSQSAESGLYTFIRLFFAWRNTSKQPLRLVLLPALMAALTFATFIIAGGFSATISTSTGQEVLLDSSECGVRRATSPEEDAEYFTWSTNIAYDLANYAQQCYSSDTAEVLDCTTFVQPFLPSTIDRNASCPFPDETICKSQSNNLFLETGFIDTGLHLGINAREEDRIFFRKQSHCAPLVNEGYTSEFRYENITYTRYHHGTMQLGQDQGMESLNYSHQIDSSEVQYPNIAPGTIRTANILLSSYGAAYYNDSLLTLFSPIEGLRRPDADFTLFYLSGNGVYFTEQVNDPWYQANIPTKNITFTFSTSGATTAYRLNEAASALACIEQSQICRGRPKSGEDGSYENCGVLAGGTEATRSAIPIFGRSFEGLADEDIPADATRAESWFHWFASVWSQMSKDPRSIVDRIGPSALLSQRKQRQGFQGALPDDQWQMDMAHLWNMTLAADQLAFVDATKGRPHRQSTGVYRPPNAGARDMCANQKVRSTRYGSFSVFGLCFTYALGMLIVIVSHSIEPIIDYCFRRAQRRAAINPEGSIDKKWFTHLEWITNQTLQQHRLAQEELGWGGRCWDNSTAYIPIPTEGSVVGGLNVCDPMHPVLQMPGRNALEKTFTAHTSDGSSSVLGNEAEGSIGDSSITMTMGREAADGQFLADQQSQVNGLESRTFGLEARSSLQSEHVQEPERRRSAQVSQDHWEPHQMR